MHRISRMNAADVARALEIERASSEGSTWDDRALREELDRAWGCVWVARRGDDRDDASILDAFAVTWIVADELHILNVGTHPTCRRRGLATMLLEHARSDAFARGVRKIVLEVRRSNTPAIALYRRLGFRAMAVRRAYYPDGEDAVDMLAFLDPSTGIATFGADACALDGRDRRDRSDAKV